MDEVKDGRCSYYPGGGPPSGSKGMNADPDPRKGHWAMKEMPNCEATAVEFIVGTHERLDAIVVKIEKQRAEFREADRELEVRLHLMIAAGVIWPNVAYGLGGLVVAVLPRADGSLQCIRLPVMTPGTTPAKAKNPDPDVPF